LGNALADVNIMSGSGDHVRNERRVTPDADAHELHTSRASTAGAEEDGERFDSDDDIAPAAGILVWAAVGMCLWIIVAVIILLF
jgi:hypothetical protein